MRRLLAFLLFIPVLLSAQTSPVLSIKNNALNAIDNIQSNPIITADSAFTLFSNWSSYPQIKQTGTDYLFYYDDTIFEKIPIRVYIPASYKPSEKSTCVLLLHGATGGSKFADIDTVSKFDDLLFASLKTQNYIIVRPVADPGKRFDWPINRFSMPGTTGHPNPVFKTLAEVLISLKKILNIDDDKIFAMGHSDGSDGTLGMGVYKPSLFAGLIAYNSMVDVMFARDFYIRNVLNTPLYIVHSDLDKLRSIKTTRRVVDSLKQIGADVVYKEYIGYEHYGKHLNKDLPYVPKFISSISRNSFKPDVFWETDGIDGLYNTCHWIKITQIDAAAKAASWYTPFDFTMKLHNDRKNEDFVTSVYSGLHTSSAVKVSYLNNVFTIETSRVTEAEIMISPVMVNLEEAVTIIANGKEVFKGKVTADKNFIVNQFKNNFDRDALWVTSIKVKTNN